MDLVVLEVSQDLQSVPMVERRTCSLTRTSRSLRHPSSLYPYFHYPPPGSETNSMFLLAHTLADAATLEEGRD